MEIGRRSIKCKSVLKSENLLETDKWVPISFFYFAQLSPLLVIDSDRLACKYKSNLAERKISHDEELNWEVWNAESNEGGSRYKM